MISILLSNVTLILGARSIFRELTWEIQHDQKIGLIGPNGAGKSSLLKVITGEYTPEPGGSAVRARAIYGGIPVLSSPSWTRIKARWKLRWRDNRASRRSKPSWKEWKPAWATRRCIRIPKRLQRALASQQASAG